jgi:exodeoxyribonuclease VII large subunit
LVTSPTGAAIRDVLHVVGRRDPGLKVVLAPCRVQGDGAAQEIASAIKLLNEFNANSVRSQNASESATGDGESGIDLILVTRGGGSLEDLWAFNEEVVARAIAASGVPVVSAVGHEIDFTISDFVADLRVATPSAAAEIITEGIFSSCQFVAEAGVRLRQLCREQLAMRNDLLDRTGQRLARMHPRRRFNLWLQLLDELRAGLRRSVKQGTRQNRVGWRNLAERLSRIRPAQDLVRRRELFEQERQRLREQARHRWRERQAGWAALRDRLRLLGPEQVLGRGYSITRDAATGKILRDAGEVTAGQRLKTRLKTGEIYSQAEK